MSLDGGKSWHPAIGRKAWSYQARFGYSGTWNVLSRAVDDSGNVVVAGGFNGTMDFGGGPLSSLSPAADIYLLKLAP